MKTNKLNYNIIFFASFILIWFAVTIYNFFKPVSDFSENENRYLAKFPKAEVSTILDGTYMNDIENYINDRFVARDFWISMQSVLQYASGKRENNGVYICSDKSGTGALISKLNGPNDAYIDKNIAAINRFIDVTGLPATLMVVPSASSIQSYKLPPLASPWDEKAVIDRIYSDVKAGCLSVYETLSAHKDEYIYYRTDHHWTTFGASLAYKAYCEYVGLKPAEFTATEVSKSFNGTLYSSSGVRFIKSDTINAYKYSGKATCIINDGTKQTERDSIYFDEFLDKKDKYAYFLGQNQPVITVTGEAGGGKLLIFKDSYAHCMAPMLLENYSEITLVDLRYINKSFDRYFNIGDYDRVLFLYSIDSFVNYDDIGRLTLVESGK